MRACLSHFLLLPGLPGRLSLCLALALGQAVAATGAPAPAATQAAKARTPAKPAPKPAARAPARPAKAKPPAKPAAKPVNRAPAKAAAKPAPAKPAPKPAPATAPPTAAASTAAGGAVSAARPASSAALAKAVPAGVAGAALAATAAQASTASAPAPMTELAGWCRQVANRLSGPVFAPCQASGLQAGDGRSVQGVPIWHRDVLPARGPERLRVLVLGGIHGDEMASVNVVFDWLQRAQQKTDEPIHWRMVPLVNPDGLMNKPSTRVNARGVDLNRNFPTPDWASNAQSYWVSRTGRDPRRFPGPRAMSEPETQWVQKQVDQFKPHLIVSVHAPYGVLDFDGPPPAPEKMGSLHLDQVGIYPGSLGNYGGVVRRVPVVTLELRNARQVASGEVGAMWSDLLDWIDRRMDTMAQLRSADAPRTR
jgi:protein MpaA